MAAGAKCVQALAKARASLRRYTPPGMDRALSVASGKVYSFLSMFMNSGQAYLRAASATPGMFAGCLGVHGGLCLFLAYSRVRLHVRLSLWCLIIFSATLRVKLLGVLDVAASVCSSIPSSLILWDWNPQVMDTSEVCVIEVHFCPPLGFEFL